MFSNSRLLAAAACLIAAGAALALPARPQPAAAATAYTPTFTSSGDMLPPTHYREWIYLTSGMDMSYLPTSAEMQGQSMFDNVFVNPEAYRSFLSTGTWPDKTVLVLEGRGAHTKGSINKLGHFQGTDLMDIEVHVKDEARFPGKWAFFSFDSPTSKGTLIPTGAPCYSCHAAHGAVDSTFVQFYPTLLPLAQQKGTLSAAFLKQEAAENAAGPAK